MFSRVRSFWVAGGGALALAVAVSGVVAAATVMTVLSSPATDPVPQVVAASGSFVDLDGNGVDDRCQTNVVADPVAAASAAAAADLNGDGVVSVSEAAQSGRIGGTTCNHGGYVSSVAKGDCAPAAPTSSGDPAASGAPDASTADVPDASGDPSASAAADTTTTCGSTDQASTDQASADCTAAAPAASGDPTASADPTVVGSAAPLDTAPNAHGMAVSAIAQSDAIGGKNCNHGGAVSAAAHQNHDAAKSARAAAKAARDAARLARAAARNAKHHGPHGG